mmetsp:Transcript_6170/g.15372  ORF Transcript_6170/g.15372 Transcript_6170/m.15372 type:complete len:203 (+) Transcript_6170:521-1129(+)
MMTIAECSAVGSTLNRRHHIFPLPFIFIYFSANTWSAAVFTKSHRGYIIIARPSPERKQINMGRCCDFRVYIIMMSTAAGEQLRYATLEPLRFGLCHQLPQESNPAKMFDTIPTQSGLAAGGKVGHPTLVGSDGAKRCLESARCTRCVNFLRISGIIPTKFCLNILTEAMQKMPPEPSMGCRSGYLEIGPCGKFMDVMCFIG